MDRLSAEHAKLLWQAQESQKQAQEPKTPGFPPGDILEAKATPTLYFPKFKQLNPLLGKSVLQKTLEDLQKPDLTADELLELKDNLLKKPKFLSVERFRRFISSDYRESVDKLNKHIAAKIKIGGTPEGAIEALKTILAGERFRKQMLTPKQIRERGVEAFQEAGLTPEQIKITSRQAAYEIAGVGVNRKGTQEYRRNIDTLYRDPDSLPTTNEKQFTGYKEQKSTNVAWVDPKKSRVTVTGSYLASGGLGKVYAAADIEGSTVESKIVKVSRPGKKKYMLAGNKIIKDNFTGYEIKNLGLAGVLKDTARRDPQGRIEATDVRYAGDLQQQKNNMSLDQRFEAMKQVARTLKAFHAKGLIHRDIKPENILIDKDGGAHVSDFDFVLRAGEPGDGAGTVGFIDAWSLNGTATYFQDAYALAVTIQETLSPQEIQTLPELQKALKMIFSANFVASNNNAATQKQRKDAYDQLMKALE